MGGYEIVLGNETVSTEGGSKHDLGAANRLGQVTRRVLQKGLPPASQGLIVYGFCQARWIDAAGMLVRQAVEP